MVKKYVEVLTRLKFRNTAQNVSPIEIGVVTPYIRQVPYFYLFIKLL